MVDKVEDLNPGMWTSLVKKHSFVDIQIAERGRRTWKGTWLGRNMNLKDSSYLMVIAEGKVKVIRFSELVLLHCFLLVLHDFSFLHVIFVDQNHPDLCHLQTLQTSCLHLQPGSPDFPGDHLWISLLPFLNFFFHYSS